MPYLCPKQQISLFTSRIATRRNVSVRKLAASRLQTCLLSCVDKKQSNGLFVSANDIGLSHKSYEHLHKNYIRRKNKLTRIQMQYFQVINVRQKSQRNYVRSS